MLKTLCLFCCLLVITSCSKPLEPTQKLQVAAIGLHAVALADNGESAVIGSIHHGISFWRIADGERLFDWSHKSPTDTTMLSADISPDGAWAITADTHTLALWDAQTGAALRFWQAPGEILSVQLGPNGNYALLGLSDHTAVWFDVRKGGILQTLNHKNRVRSVALSDDGKIGVTGSEDYTAIAWNLSTGEAMGKIRHNDDVQLVALSADGELALSMAKYDRALLWSTTTGDIQAEIPLAAQRLKRGLRFTAARFSEDKRWLLTGRPDQQVTLWQIPELIEKARWQIPSKNSWKPTRTAILDVTFGADEKHFFAAGSNGIIYHLELP